MNENIIRKLDEFFMRSSPLTYEKDEIIVRAYDPIFGIFYLKNGYVRQYILTQQGQEATIHLFRPVAFFPMMLVLDDTPNRFTFQAASRVQVWRASPESVLQFLKREPDVLLDLASRFSKGLNGLATRLEHMLYERVQQKLISLLLYLAEQFGITLAPRASKSETPVRIELSLTHSDLATWIGTQRETVSRSMEKLKKDKIISYEKNIITILSLQRLKDEL